ncbi:MAG TPA: hypothetical protein VK190_04490 [Pseudoneobacillus sp.]|nr:hypothetical protein [Pseudoneobacillus sp.]
MAILKSISGVDMLPTIPQNTNGQIASVAVGSYSTILDITGKGVLSRISASTGSSGYLATIKITIDNNTTITIGMNNSSGASNLVAGTYNSNGISTYLGSIKFNSSLKVELGHTNVNAQSVGYAVDYALF